MRWLKKKLRNWIREDDIYPTEAIRMRDSDEPDGKCLRFKVFRANGGTVVQTEYYDSVKDRHNTNLHVIVEGQDLGNELGKIVTYESLKL